MNRNMQIRAIRSRKQYQDYLAIAEELMEIDPTANSEEGKLLETLVILIDAYVSPSLISNDH